MVYDDTGEKLRPVVGGYLFENIVAKIPIKFRTIGEFLFSLKDHPNSPSPCKVKVVEERPINVILGEDGFNPKSIKIGTIEFQSKFFFYFFFS